MMRPFENQKLIDCEHFDENFHLDGDSDEMRFSINDENQETIDLASEMTKMMIDEVYFVQNGFRFR